MYKVSPTYYYFLSMYSHVGMALYQWRIPDFLKELNPRLPSLQFCFSCMVAPIHSESMYMKIVFNEAI